MPRLENPDRAGAAELLENGAAEEPENRSGTAAAVVSFPQRLIKCGPCHDWITRQATVSIDRNKVHSTIPAKPTLIEVKPDYLLEKYRSLELCRVVVFPEDRSRDLTEQHGKWLDRTTRHEGKWTVASAGVFEDLRIDANHHGSGERLGIVVYARIVPDQIDNYDGSLQWEMLWLCDERVIHYGLFIASRHHQPWLMEFRMWIENRCWFRQSEVETLVSRWLNPEARRDQQSPRLTRLAEPLSQQDLYAEALLAPDSSLPTPDSP